MRPKPLALAALALALVLPVSPAAAAEVHYFNVPQGDHPHDVAPAPDGTVWYTGQRAGVLGRLDPNTGQVERIALGQGSAPHGVIIGPDGAAWVTDGGLNAIVRVDPATREVKSLGSCRRTAPTRISTRLPSTDATASGSPGSPAFMVGSIRRAAKCRFGTRRRA